MNRKIKISLMILIWSIVAIQMFVNYREDERHTTSTFFVIEDE